jgi:hypothetical protein
MLMVFYVLLIVQLAQRGPAASRLANPSSWPAACR